MSNNDDYDKELQKKLCAYLKSRREGYMLSQQDVVTRICVTQQAISKLESGKYDTSTMMLIKYCRCLGVDLFKAVKEHCTQKG